jgi:hypothetical protein
MLQWLRNARTQLRLMTSGEVDILGAEEFALLRALVEKVTLPTPEE